jgi:four helix bundle protein
VSGGECGCFVIYEEEGEMNHKDLEVWKEGIGLVTEIYKLTSLLPDSEKYGLASQMRRAAISIPSNIAEGAGRNSDKEFVQFLYISLGSIEELETQLIIGTNLEFFKTNNLESVFQKIVHIRKLLIGLIKYLKNKSK